MLIKYTQNDKEPSRGSVAYSRIILDKGSSAFFILREDIMALYAFDGAWNEDEEAPEHDTNVVRFRDFYQ